MAIRILLTGYGAFPGARSNPSAALVQAVQRTHKARLARIGIELHTVILPVEFNSLPNALQQNSNSVSPAAILHVGLAGRRRAVHVELQARNRLSLLHPDAAGRHALATRIHPGAEVLKSTLPAPQLLQILRVHRLPAVVSMDAGSYVCNQTLYLTLARGAGIKAGFIHIPRLAVAGAPFARLTQAMAHVVMAMAVAVRPAH